MLSQHLFSLTFSKFDFAFNQPTTRMTLWNRGSQNERTSNRELNKQKHRMTRTGKKPGDDDNTNWNASCRAICFMLCVPFWSSSLSFCSLWSLLYFIRLISLFRSIPRIGRISFFLSCLFSLFCVFCFLYLVFTRNVSTCVLETYSIPSAYCRSPASNLSIGIRMKNSTVALERLHCNRKLVLAIKWLAIRFRTSAISKPTSMCALQRWPKR